MLAQSDLTRYFKIIQNKIPGQLIIQMTDHCNALCPQCGMRKTADFQRSILEVDKIKRYIDKAAENGVEAISFTGGEPMLFFKQLVELIDHAAKAGIEYIRTGTNGYMLRYGKSEDEFQSRVRRVVDALAKTKLRNFWISIDSADPKTHEEMRGFDGLIKGIEKVVPMFHEAGLYPSANLGINRNLGGPRTMAIFQEPGQQDDQYLERFHDEFCAGFDRFYRFVKDMGFTTVNMCYPMSVGTGNDELASVYTATSIDKVVNFSRQERVQLFNALLHVVPQYRSELRIFTPLAALYALKKQYQEGKDLGYGCRGGVDFFFVDSKDGKTYPCGFRGDENLGDYDQLDMSTVDRNDTCNKCDWECFRDPSFLFGPFLEGIRTPISLFRKLKKEPLFFDLWRCDLAYYQACELFSGRKAPDYGKLQNFLRERPSILN